MTTEFIDKLYLELAQVTKAKTYKELEMESQIKTLRESLDSFRVKDSNGHSLRPAVLRVMSCKDGKPPVYDPSHTPELLRFIRDEETTSMDGTPWFIVAFVPVSVFGSQDES